MMTDDRMSTHRLKIHPEHFKAVLNGTKRVELRKNDRNYQVGDTLILWSWNPDTQSYTGSFVTVVVTHILAGGPWLADGYVALSIRTVGDIEQDAVVIELLKEAAKRGAAIVSSASDSLLMDKDAEIERLNEAIKGATRAANIAGSLIREKDAEIERLKSQLQSWKDTGMATATEARLLHELARDQDRADALLSDYPVIEFYTLLKVGNIERWDKVYGKKITLEGLEFGSYFDPKIMCWHIVELVCGMSAGYAVTFGGSLYQITELLNRMGVESIKALIGDEQKKHKNAIQMRI